MKKPKTLKREFAFFGVWLPFMALIALVAIQGGPQVQLQLIEILWLPVAVLVGGAFGLDAVGKQIRRPEVPPPDHRTEPTFDDGTWPVDMPHRS